MEKVIERINVNSEENLREILNNYSQLICKVERDKKTDICLKEIKDYSNSNFFEANNPKLSQAGRLWILVGIKESETIPLQVGQSIDILSEISVDINKAPYQEYLKQYDEICFYEISIENYLKDKAPENIQEIIYEMCKEYFAEALVAASTKALDWNFYKSGIDKRSLFYILDNIL